MKTIKFICKAVKWFDKVNGNTYHSVRITRTEDAKTISHEWTYGYGDAYRQTALNTMLKAGWLPETYNEKNIWQYERENNYPIFWDEINGLKRDMIANGKI